MILICNPSVSTIIAVGVTLPPADAFNVVVTPILFVYLIVPTPVIKLPWTLSKIISLVFPIPAILNLAFFPTDTAPIVVIPKTSPIWYPDPPLVIVAAIATPLLIFTCAIAPLPFPVIVTKFTPAKVKLPLVGVYPIPALETDNVPVADPATPTRLPVAFVPNCENVFPKT